MIQLLELVPAAADPACKALSGGHEGQPTTRLYTCTVALTSCSQNTRRFNCISFNSFIHSFIHSRIYKAPLQEIYLEAPPAKPRRYRSVLSNLQNVLSLFLGRIRICMFCINRTKWRDLTGVICDPKITVALKAKIYNTMIRSVMMYGAEAWTLRRKKEKLLERIEMRMLRWILGISLKDMQRNENIRKKIGVACITDKIREARLRWYGHVERSGDTNIRRIMKSEVQGLRSRGRQKKRYMDMIQEDLKFLNLKPDDTGGRDMWRQRIRVADPSPAGD